MYWQAMRVEPWIDHGCLRAGFAAVFGLDPTRIQVTDDPLTLTGPIPPEPRMLLETFRREGPFPLQFDGFLAGDELERPVADLAGSLIKAQGLARRLNAVLLLGDGPIGHDEQLRVAPDGTVDVVELDGDEMDEERFIVVGARPFSDLPAEAAQAPA
jgi:hypothetical protein